MNKLIILCSCLLAVFVLIGGKVFIEKVAKSDNRDMIIYKIEVFNKIVSVLFYTLGIILIIFTLFIGYKEEKYLESNKYTISNYKWTISSIDFNKNLEIDSTMKELIENSIDKTVSFRSDDRVTIAGNAFTYDFIDENLNLENEDNKTSYKIEVCSNNKVKLFNEDYEIVLKKIQIRSYEELLAVNEKVKKEVMDSVIEKFVRESKNN